MSSNRRKRDQDEEESQVAAKKTKKSEDDVIWEWQGDKSVWTDYDKDISKEITEAFKNGKPKVTVEIKTTKFDIIFAQRMVQKNAITGWERRIRLKTSEPQEKWEWQDEFENWNEYSDEIQSLFHAAKSFSLKRVDFSVKGAQYQLNLLKKEQINKKTRVKRKVRQGQEDEQVNGDEVESATALAKKVKKEEKTSPETSKPHPKAKRQRVASQDTVVKSEPEETKKKESEVKSMSVVMKGKVPVDQNCPAKDTHHVLCEGKVIWDAMLNQTNVKNNNNKFYLMQLLEEDKAKRYAVWFRWGRVGLTGQSNLVRCGYDLQEARDTFRKKFEDKTKNDWDYREAFRKVAGKYDLLRMDYDANTKDEDSVDGTKEEKVETRESKLESRLQCPRALVVGMDIACWSAEKTSFLRQPPRSEGHFGTGLAH